MPVALCLTGQSYSDVATVDFVITHFDVTTDDIQKISC